jgi:hypothetical protein
MIVEICVGLNPVSMACKMCDELLATYKRDVTLFRISQESSGSLLAHRRQDDAILSLPLSVGLRTHGAALCRGWPQASTCTVPTSEAKQFLIAHALEPGG